MKRLLIALVKFYRRYISPLKPPCCRFIPTCSEYALEALQKYGALKGVSPPRVFCTFTYICHKCVISF